MTWPVEALIKWLLSAAVTMAAVRFVTPGNPRNTLARALAVTFLVAALLTPMTWFAILVVPLVIAAVAWFAIYMIAYDLGPLQATGVGLLQILIGWGVGVLLRAIGWVATSGPPPPI